MITSSTAPRIASVIALKSSISYDGVPSGLRAWVWIWAGPSSTARRASSADSSRAGGPFGFPLRRVGDRRALVAAGQHAADRAADDDRVLVAAHGSSS